MEESKYLEPTRDYSPSPRDRVLRIVEHLIHKEMTTYELEYNLFGTLKEHHRTIQMDLEYIEGHFGDKYIKIKKDDTYYYKLVNLPHAMQDVYKNSPEEIRRIYEFIGLFDADMLSMFEEQEPLLIRDIRKQIDTLYTLVSTPFEYIEYNDIWHSIKKAISIKRYVSIEYKKNKLVVFAHVKPIKILFANDNWYLAIVTSKEKYQFTPLRISNIVSIKLESGKNSTFKQDKNALKHIENLQSLFERYNVPKYEVRLKVDASISPYFKKKKYLKSQRIIQEDKKDHSLIISYRINNDQEIFPVIQKWIPHIHIIEPLELKNKIEHMLKKYLSSF